MVKLQFVLLISYYNYFLGLTLHSPSVRSDSPDFMFAPIAPANEAMNKQDDVMTVIQDSDVDVQPLLDSVIPHQTVKG